MPIFHYISHKIFGYEQGSKTEFGTIVLKSLTFSILKTWNMKRNINQRDINISKVKTVNIAKDKKN